MTSSNPTGDYPEVDMLGGIFHIWFGAFIGKQTMKTRAVSVCELKMPSCIVSYYDSTLLIYILYIF